MHQVSCNFPCSFHSLNAAGRAAGLEGDTFSDILRCTSAGLKGENINLPEGKKGICYNSGCLGVILPVAYNWCHLFCLFIHCRSF